MTERKPVLPVTTTVTHELLEDRLAVIMRLGDRRVRRYIEMSRFSRVKAFREVIIKGAIYDAKEDALRELQAGGGELIGQ